MSDSVTNVEIEDVLSSIRKLVSDDPRPSEKGVSAPDTGKDRLVLTPDFRVTDPDPAESEDTLFLTPDAAISTPAEEAQAAEDDGDALDADAVVEVDAVSNDITAQDDAFTFEDVDPVTADPDAPQNAPVAEEPSEDAIVFEDDVAEDAQSIDIAALNDAIMGVDVAADEAAPEMTDDHDAAPMSEDVPSDVYEAEILEMAPTAAPTHLEARIAELEAAVAQQDESWDPDGLDDSDANTPEALKASVSDVWETVEPEELPIGAAPDDMTLEAKEEAQDAADADEGLENFVTEDDAMLDEEALREMVSELVRQELQGTLGARITRNVRKLVRREIHRIMDSKDFD